MKTLRTLFHSQQYKSVCSYQVLTSPHSRSSPCMISNEPARNSNCRIPKDLFLLIARLQPPFNSYTSSSLTLLAQSQITSNSSPDLWSTDLGCSAPVWYYTCSDLFSVFFMLSDSLLSIVLSFLTKLSQCMSLKYLIIRGIIPLSTSFTSCGLIKSAWW